MPLIKAALARSLHAPKNFIRLMQNTSSHKPPETSPVSYHRKIASGALWVTVFLLAARMVGAAKEMIVAWRYGVDIKLDAYLFVFNLLNWPISIWFSVLTVGLIPLITHAKKDGEKSRIFKGELIAFTIFFGLCFGLASWFILPAVMEKVGGKVEQEVLREAVRISGVMSLLLPLGVLSNLFSVMCMASGSHRNTLFDGLPALTIGLSLIVLQEDLDPLVLGTVAGFLVQLLVLFIYMYGKGELVAPRLRFTSALWKDFRSSMAILLVGQILTTSTVMVDQFFAASLGQGSLSELSYSNRLLSLILSMGAMVISRATLPTLSELSLTGTRRAESLARQWAKWLFLIGMVAVIVIHAVAPQLVSLMFQRGAFLSENSDQVVGLLRYSSVQIPFYFCNLVLVSALASRRRYSVIATAGALNLFFKLVLSYFLVDRMGLSGLVLSTAGMYFFSLMFLFLRTR